MNKYLITKDTVPTLVHKLGILEIRGRPDIQNQISLIENQFIDSFSRVLRSGTQVQAIDAQSVDSKINRKISDLTHSNSTHFVISLDRVYIPNANYHIEVTRSLDPETGELSPLTNRFNSPSLEVQITHLKAAIGIKEKNNMGRTLQVTLADVGSFEGTTLKTIMGMLNEQGIKADNIVLGISTQKGLENLKESGLNVKVLSNVKNFYEWMELRDLLLIDGRKAPEKYSIDNIRAFIPYSDMLVREASVPEENEKEAREICIDAHNKISILLAKLDVKPSRIGRHVSLTEEAKINRKQKK